jgi:hypothetical protein
MLRQKQLQSLKNKSMKNLKILVGIALCALIFFSCENENTELGNSEIETISELYSVRDGILCFKDEQSLEKTIQVLGLKNYSELTAWEESHNFMSIERASIEIMDAICCRADEFVAGGISQDEVLDKFNKGEIQELLPDIEHRLNKLQLNYNKDENGIRYINYKFNVPVSYRILNEDYAVIIGDTLYKYYDNRMELYPNYSKNKNIEPIIGYKSRIGNSVHMEKSVPSTISKRLCFDDKNDGTSPGDHRLTVDLYAERYIFQKPGCTSNCVWTKAKIYLQYQGYYRGWFSWRTGDYGINFNGAFDVEYERLGVSSSFRVEIPTTTILSSPSNLYRITFNINGLEDEPSSYYPYIAFGNVDCFYMTLGALPCAFNQANGTNGTTAGAGYLPMYYMYNSY